jgi:diguanylate cyclase (GGDEF)-like protein
VLRIQNAILEMVAVGEPLDATANRLCGLVEEMLPEIACSIVTVDRAGFLHPLAAPSLPLQFAAVIDGVAIGPNVGSCGTAAYLGEPVAVEDIETDPRWADHSAHILPLGYRACWSTPIVAGDAEVVGAFAFYYRDRRGPSYTERQVVAACVHLCAIAIDRAAQAREQQRLAYEDALTGLPNRAAFDAAISRLSCATPGAWALLIVDLDNLKLVNDSFGHRAGDGLIRAVASRIAQTAAPDRAFRLGGDEFAVIVETPEAADLDRAAGKILSGLVHEVQCEGHVIMPRATIGGAMLEARDASAEVVRQNADFALYHAKETNRGVFMRYSADMGATMTKRLRAIHDVGAALRDGRIDAHYQPIVCLETRQIVGLESLFRLTTEAGVVLPAGEFHHATSDMHVASALTERMLSVVAQDLRDWLDLGIPFQYVSVNVSAADFQGGKLDGRLLDAFERAQVPLEHIVLEVTESVYMGAHEAVIAREIQALRAKGLLVALDDFGTGFASLTHLLSVPVDIIKIDKTFVDRLTPGDGGVAIVEGLLGIARKLGIRVVAEGIETEEQLNHLRSLGCRYGQGFLFSRAIDRRAVTQLLLQSASPKVAGAFARPPSAPAPGDAMALQAFAAQAAASIESRPSPARPPRETTLSRSAPAELKRSRRS